MAETAAYLLDQVFPPLAVRQWVLSVPKRLLYVLEREPRSVSAVLRIFLRVIEAHLCQTSPGGAAQRRGVERPDSCIALAPRSDHAYSHCCILDGVFEPREDGQI